jgi:hypothetical protein
MSEPQTLGGALNDLNAIYELLRETGYRECVEGVRALLADRDALAARIAAADTKVLGEIAAERARQDEKWGEQNHPDGTGDYPEIIDADVARMACEGAAEGGYLDWLHILREEVAEAFAESAPDKLRAELVQVAAVAVAWVEAIDRRTPHALDGGEDRG